MGILEGEGGWGIRDRRWGKQESHLHRPRKSEIDTTCQQKTKLQDQTHNFHDKMCICVKQTRLTYLLGVNVLVEIKTR